MGVNLLAVERSDDDIAVLLEANATIERAYLQQDSGCVSYVVTQRSRRLFVKSARTDAGQDSLRRAEALHRAIRHPVLPRLLHTFRAADAPVHVYEGVPGEILYDYVSMDGERGRSDPSSPHRRFRNLPVGRILEALDAVFNLHVAIAAAGFVAVDFYDGCILHDFDGHRTWVCDLDEYRPGPFNLDAERLPGSRRFMAPEELVRDSTIDQRTNVFTLGRTAAVFLGGGNLNSPDWRGGEALREVARRATSPERVRRYETVAGFVKAWGRAAGS